MLLRDKARLFTDSVVKQFKLFDCESSIILTLDQSCFVGPYWMHPAILILIKLVFINTSFTKEYII